MKIRKKIYLKKILNLISGICFSFCF